MIKIEVASAQRIEEFYGQPPTRTQKSLAVIEDGEVVSIVGVYRDNGHAVLFSDSRPQVKGNMKKYARVAVKCVKLLTPYMDGKRVIAVADTSIPKSEAFLAHFGFIEQEDGIWQTHLQQR